MSQTIQNAPTKRKKNGKKNINQNQNQNKNKMPYKTNVTDTSRGTYNGTSKHVQQGLVVGEYTTNPSLDYAVRLYIPLPYAYDDYIIIVNSIYIMKTNVWQLMSNNEDSQAPDEVGEYNIVNVNGMANIMIGGRASILDFSTTYPVQVSYIAIRK